MYRRERSIPFRGSAAPLCNNLSVLQLSARKLTYFGVVHGPGAQLLSVAPEGVSLAQRQLRAKEGAGVSPPLMTQVRWCVLPFRVLLVLTSHRGIQMYESNGNTMVYWHALDSGDASPVQAVFARGIAASGHFIFVGTWSGRVLVFDIPVKGPNIILSEELAGHQTPITDIATEPAQGQLWQGIIAAGYGNGQVHLYEAATGNLHVQINAHARAICALDLAPEVGKLLSAGEDTFVHIWKLSRSPESGYIEVEHCHGECVSDTQLCGARFCDSSGSSFAVTGYDLAEIRIFSSV
ncbi:PREDICTED: WD repeat-containing protein 54 isoform X2 [Colobus angolensis palliatus]|uniref:WD repeat-containing protein 54 isoform X2 n=1 Tax=Colobus angolensis palliatus TaxID=336983 RepID=UPI0005F465DE|nr:PREDICTED: WD repeat-containing protein 54 isoform X2 [Colobus angolensis palliatus]